MRRDGTLTAVALASLLAACTAGSGPSRPITTEPREPTSGGPEPGATSPEPGVGGWEDPGGGSSGGGGDSGASCIQCDASYVCVVAGQTQTVSVKLVSSGGKCFIDSSTDGPEIRCDGLIVATSVDSNGNRHTTQTPWTPFGNGGFQTTTQGNPVQCSPEARTQ